MNFPYDLLNFIPFFSLKTLVFPSPSQIVSSS